MALLLLAVLLPAWILLIRTLRSARTASISALHTGPLSTMSISAAQDIINTFTQLGPSWLVEKSLGFALFRTYGIPSISSLLHKTTLFSSPASAAKRYSDTAVLIASFLELPFDTPEWRTGLARTNAIHAHYRERGEISDADMLYTLILFADQPRQWLARYEWYELSPAEKCAFGVYWKAIGDFMRIPYTGFKSHDDGSGWTDGAHWLDEAHDWAEQYEKKYMIPAESNFQVAEQTTAILTFNYPSSWKPPMKTVVAALLDDRLRESMLYSPAPMWLVTLIREVFRIRALILYNLFPPRPNFNLFRTTYIREGKAGRRFMADYEAIPYYIAPTIFNRWLSLRALWSRMLGLPLPGDDKKFMSNGYTIAEVGPRLGLKKQGHEEVVLEKRVDEARRCPLAF